MHNISSLCLNRMGVFSAWNYFQLFVGTDSSGCVLFNNQYRVIRDQDYVTDESITALGHRLDVLRTLSQTAGEHLPQGGHIESEIAVLYEAVRPNCFEK